MDNKYVVVIHCRRSIRSVTVSALDHEDAAEIVAETPVNRFRPRSRHTLRGVLAVWSTDGPPVRLVYWPAEPELTNICQDDTEEEAIEKIKVQRGRRGRWVYFEPADPDVQL